MVCLKETNANASFASSPSGDAVANEVNCLSHLATYVTFTMTNTGDTPKLKLFFVTQGDEKVLKAEVSPNGQVCDLEDAIILKRKESSRPDVGTFVACWKVSQLLICANITYHSTLPCQVK